MRDSDSQIHLPPIGWPWGCSRRLDGHVPGAPGSSRGMTRRRRSRPLFSCGISFGFASAGGGVALTSLARGLLATAARTSFQSSLAKRCRTSGGVEALPATPERTLSSSSPARAESRSTGVWGFMPTCRRTRPSSSAASGRRTATGVAGFLATQRRTVRSAPVLRRMARQRRLGRHSADRARHAGRQSRST